MISNRNFFYAIKRPRRREYTAIINRPFGEVVAVSGNNVQVLSQTGELVEDKKEFWSLMPQPQH